MEIYEDMEESVTESLIIIYSSKSLRIFVGLFISILVLVGFDFMVHQTLLVI